MNGQRFCGNCGVETQPGQRFCPNCGTPLAGDPTMPQYQPIATPPRQPPPPGKRPNWWHRRRPLTRVALIIVPALLIAGGGVAVALIVSSDGGKKPQAADATQDTSAEEERAQALEKHAKCKQAVGPLLAELHELDSRLDVGLNYDEYTDKVGDISVAYDGAAADIGGAECLAGVGVPAERALNQYVKASNVWGDCFEDINCDDDSIESTLQSHWTKASIAIDSADSGLESIKSSGA
jgi:hypothetical protein